MNVFGTVLRGLYFDSVREQSKKALIEPEPQIQRRIVSESSERLRGGVESVAISPLRGGVELVAMGRQSRRSKADRFSSDFFE